MNNAIYRSGHIQNSLTIDPFIIEDCNVIYGPSAVKALEAMLLEGL